MSINSKLGLTRYHQGPDGFLWLVLTLLERLESEGYVMPDGGSAVSAVAALRDIAGVQRGNCAIVDAIEGRLNTLAVGESR